MKGAAVASGEWTTEAASTRGIKIIDDMVQERLRHAYSRETIVFGTTIAQLRGHAGRIRPRAGVMAACFPFKTSGSQRTSRIGRRSIGPTGQDEHYRR
jgi:hypothetical protein